MHLIVCNYTFRINDYFLISTINTYNQLKRSTEPQAILRVVTCVVQY